jgi:cell volume regulation protein A
MFLVDQLILLAGVLLLIGIASSKFSMRVGMPVLVLFILVGMLAGEEGIGRIEFDDFATAHAIGTVALAVILFDGGMRTETAALRVAWKPSFLLATVGVVITALVTGLAAARILGIPTLPGLLLGSIVASTDAAAVFAVLRSKGVHLSRRLASVLEVESGSNDPMAIFLTIGLIEIITGRMEPGADVFWLFVQQMGLGALVGVGVGWLATRIINSINLPAPGLYPVMTGAHGLLAFGIAAVIGGSGFLAVYIAGIVLGNARLAFHRGTLLFLDGLAWISQISMFVVLGLLSTPSLVLAAAPTGLAIAAALIFVARPLAAVPLLLPFGFSRAEHALIAWVGLKGAVPIILGTFPLLFGVPGGLSIFNVVFFVVLVSAILQGWTLPIVARRLGLQQNVPDESPVALEINSIHRTDAEIVDYPVDRSSRVAGRELSQLTFPEGVLVAMIARDGRVIPPRGSTRIQGGDHVFVILRPQNRTAVDAVFQHRYGNG